MKKAQNEQWKPIIGFAGYEVSNLGRVRSLTRTITTKDGINRPSEGCVLHTYKLSGKKYRLVGLYRGAGIETHYVHRLVAQAFCENSDPTLKDQVNHLDGDPANNAATNLEWVSAYENLLHAEQHGLLGKPPKFRLMTVDDVREARRLYTEARLTFKKIAAQLGLTPSQIGAAVRRRTFRWVV